MNRRVLALLGAVAVSATAAGCALPGGARGPLELTATFDDVGDLVVGHAVQVADVRVGTVSAIDLTDDYKAKLTLNVVDSVKIPKASSAVLRTTSLLGEKFIELRPDGSPTQGPFYEKSAAEADRVVPKTSEAPELEFFAEQAINVLGGVAANDIATLVETGAVGFGGRGADLAALVDNLAIISDTLADGTPRIVQVIDGLDTALGELAAGSSDLDQLLLNLSETSQVLADNSDNTIDAVRNLTNLARISNDTVLEPYRNEMNTQIKQVDAIAAKLGSYAPQVGALLDAINLFAERVPQAAPENNSYYAQVYGWFVITGTGEAAYG